MNLPRRESGVSSRERPGFFDGFVHLWSQPWSRALVILTGTFSVFGFAFMPMLPVFAREALQGECVGVSPAGLGGGRGASVAASLPGGRGPADPSGGSPILVAGAVFGVSLVAAALARSYWVALPLLVIAGMAMVMNNVLTKYPAPDGGAGSCPGPGDGGVFVPDPGTGAVRLARRRRRRRTLRRPLRPGRGRRGMPDRHRRGGDLRWPAPEGSTPPRGPRTLLERTGESAVR